jgi:hypothetical protein
MGHLGCFHSLTIVNKDAINISVQVHFGNLTYIPSGTSLEVVLLDHMVVLLFFLLL